MLYLMRTGRQWRHLPREHPRWGAVWWHFRRWQLDGVWLRVHETLRRAVRVQAGRDAGASVGTVDSQSARTTEEGACAACSPD